MSRARLTVRMSTFPRYEGEEEISRSSDPSRVMNARPRTRRRIRKSGRLIRQSCYGPCVVFKDEPWHPRWGCMRGQSNPVLFLAATLDGSHFAIVKEESEERALLAICTPQGIDVSGPRQSLFER